MKIGILADCLGLGFAGGVRRAAELGADGVQLYAVEGELAPENMSTEKRAWARRIVRDAGIEISAICGDLGEGGFAFAEKNRGKIDYTKKIVELAVDLGCRIVTTHIGVVPHDVNHPRFQVIADALRELGAFAASAGAAFAIETGPEPAADLRRMLEYVASPGVKVNLDPANLVMCTGDSAVDAVNTLRDYIVHTHAKDGVMFKCGDLDVMYGMTLAPADYDESAYCLEVPLGEGQVHFETYIPALRTIGYDGYLTIEREVGEDPARDIALAIDFLKKYTGGK